MSIFFECVYYLRSRTRPYYDLFLIESELLFLADFPIPNIDNVTEHLRTMLENSGEDDLPSTSTAYIADQHVAA